MRKELKDHRQLLFRFLGATVAFALVLVVLVWKKNDLVGQQRDAAAVITLTTDLGRSLNRLFVVADGVTPQTAPSSRSRAATRIADEVARAKALVARVEAPVSPRSRPYLARFRELFYSDQTGMSRDVGAFLSDAAGFAEALRHPATPSSPAPPQRESLLALVSALDSVRQQTAIEGEALLGDVERMQAAMGGFVLVLFVAVGAYLILPANRLLKAQQEEYEKAVAYVKDRNADLLRSAEELRRAKTDAESASRAKSEFLANISHEIRTPMTAILGYADMLLSPTLGPEQRGRHVQVIRRNGRMLMKLIDDLLNISKIEAGKLEVERTSVSLQEIVSEVYSLLHCRALEKNVELAVSFEGPVPATIQTDPTRLRQILINIVGNAVKFTEKGSVHLAVRYDTLLEFEVTDTGCGIPVDAAEKLFEPFVQADTTTTRRYGGTGLGLVLSRRLARALGGDLVLKTSSLEAGSAFVATVDPGPVAPGALVSKLSLKDILSQSEDDSVLPSTGLEGVRALVVEDSAENRELFAIYLETAGASVVTACDGEDGIRKAMAEPFDVVLMDVQMPRMDGYQAVASLKERRYAVPVVAITAHAMAEERERCAQAGFDEYLVKPIEASALVAAVKRLALVQKSFEEKVGGLVSAELVDEDRLLGASERVRSIFARFVATIPDEVSRIRQTAKAGDWDKLLALTHKLKGTAGNCGFPSLAEQATRLEDDVRRTDGSAARGGELELRLQELDTLAKLSVSEFERLWGTVPRAVAS